MSDNELKENGIRTNLTDKNVGDMGYIRKREAIDTCGGYGELAYAMTAWEPLPAPEEGKCGSCRYLDRNIGYLTCPMKYRCKKTGELHFERDNCDVPAFCREE